MRIIKFLFLIACLGGIVYLHVWQRVQIIRLGYDIAANEDRREQLLSERRLLKLEYSRVSALQRFSGDAPDGFSGSTFESMEVVDVLVPRNSIGGENGLEE